MKWQGLAWIFSGAVVGALGVQQLAPAPSVDSADCERSLEKRAIRRQKLESSLYSEALSMRMIAARAGQTAGQPTPWPDNPPALLLPSAIQASVEMGLEEAGLGELTLLMCDEYPCVVGVTLGPPGPARRVSASDYDGLFSALDMVGYGDFKRSFLRVSHVAVGTQEQSFAVFALHEANVAADEARRIPIRAEQGLTSMQAVLGE